jgi:DNA replicative helicase MCM subunit Mcm2 (Cdc46/Mcm family)
MKEASYNCPSCRYNCAPDIKEYFTANQTKHCDWHEEKVGGDPSVH